MSVWTVGGYTEVRELGAGAQGRVVLARHDESGTPVAIKYLNKSADETQREQLRHEARMLGRADNAHIARLHRLAEGPDGVAIIMEAVDGVSLKELLAREGALGPEASLAVLKGSLLGLAAAHALGVVHRDYKPANVVVPADGLSRLVDFGIAAFAGAEAGGAGTPYYMAPEQWDRHIATPATDVYAATCVFVECAGGRRPYAGGRAALMLAHRTAEIPVETVPEPLRPLVARGMAKAPEDRPAGASAFVEELEAVAVQAYGPDWEHRGVRALAASAAALAALFPLAASLLPGAAAQGAGETAGQAAAQWTGDTAAHGAGDASVQTAGQAAAGKAGAGGLKVALGVGAAACGTVVAIGAGAMVALQPDEARPRAGAGGSAAPDATRTAAVAAVTQCTRTGPGGEPVQETPGRTRMPLPEAVTMPAGAAMYHVAGAYLIGPAGAECGGTVGAASGLDFVGDPQTGVVQRSWQGSIGGIGLLYCKFLPLSPEAEKQRANGDFCGSTLLHRQKLRTGKPGLRVVIGQDMGRDEHPPAPYVSVVLGTFVKDGPTGTTRCIMPAGKADICKAALTYALYRTLGETPLDARLPEQIAALVEKARR